MTEPYALTFIVPGLPKLPNRVKGHWGIRSREVKHWHNLVHLLTLGKRPAQPLPRVQLIFTRVSTTRPDFDNLVASFKPVQDALILCRIIQNDRNENIKDPLYRWLRGPHSNGYIEVQIKEVSNGKDEYRKDEAGSP